MATCAGLGPGLYAASFTVHFPVPGTYYLASCYPYTYTDLQARADEVVAPHVVVCCVLHSPCDGGACAVPA